MPIRKGEQGPTAIWLLNQIDRYLSLNNMPNDGCLFGWALSRDRTLVERLRDGGDVTTSKMDEILAFMQQKGNVIQTKMGSGDSKAVLLKPLAIEKRSLP